MPYNSYAYPQYGYVGAQPTITAVPQPTPTVPQPESGLVWVQGIEGAKSYLLGPNKTALLMDSEREQFFIKSTDASGMPLPLRIFQYSEIGNKDRESNYVTKAEFDALASKFDALSKQVSVKEAPTNAEPAV